MKSQTEWYVERDGVEYILDLTFHFSPFRPGRKSGPPEDCYPDEGGDVEDIQCFHNGEPFELTAEEEGKAEEWLAERIWEGDLP